MFTDFNHDIEIMLGFFAWFFKEMGEQSRENSHAEVLKLRDACNGTEASTISHAIHALLTLQQTNPRIQEAFSKIGTVGNVIHQKEDHESH
jgi:hypothetical protein